MSVSPSTRVPLLNFCLQHSVLPLKLWRGEKQICHSPPPPVLGDDCPHPFYDMNRSIDNKLRGGPNDKDVICRVLEDLGHAESCCPARCHDRPVSCV